MSVPAARIRTTSGWRDLAIQGAPGPPGFTPSSKAQSNIAFAAADGYYRGISTNFTSVIYDDLGIIAAGAITIKATGRYLIGVSYEAMANTGVAAIAANWSKRHTGQVTKGTDGQTFGTETWYIANLTAGSVFALAGFHTGGGTAVCTVEVIRLDAPPVYLQTKAPQYVTPAQFAALTPVDGLEVYLIADATNGVIWHLRYNASSSSAYKWEFLGGPPLAIEGVAGVVINPGASYNGFPEALTVPRAGDYDVFFGGNTYGMPNGAWSFNITVKVGAAVAGDTESFQFNGGVNAAINTPGSRKMRMAALAASTQLQLCGKVSGGAGLGFEKRWLHVEPVRIS